MRGEHGQCALGRLEDEHEDLRPRRIVLHRRPAAPVLRVPKRRLVAVVAVGQRDGVGAESRADLRDGLVLLRVLADRGGPQAMFDAGVVGQLGDRRLPRELAQPSRDPPASILAQAHDRTGVHPGCP
jgi:hypothetical protein